MEGSSEYDFRRHMDLALERPEAADFKGLLHIIESASQTVLSHINGDLAKKYSKYDSKDLPPELTRDFLEDLMHAFNEGLQALAYEPSNQSGPATQKRPRKKKPKNSADNATKEKPLEEKSAKEKPGIISVASTSAGLAKISFNEGEELLSRGDLKGAIAHFREAIGYDNRNDYYLYQLALALAQDKETREEARTVLQRAIDLNRNNANYHAQLGLLYKESGDTYKATGAFTLALRIDPDHVVAKRELAALKAAENAKLQPKKSSDELEASKVEIAKQQEEIRPSRIRTINIVVLILIVTVVVIALSRSTISSRVEITPLQPEARAMVSPSHMEFRWSCSVENVDFLFQIFEGEQKVVERYTRDNMYILSKDDIKRLKPEQLYKWRVIPISPKRQQIPYTPFESEFLVSAELP